MSHRDICPDCGGMYSLHDLTKCPGSKLYESPIERCRKEINRAQIQLKMLKQKLKNLRSL